MNWLDILVILVLVAFVAAAFSAGLIREVVTLCAVVFGVVIAGALYDDLATDVLVFIDDEEGARAVAFLVLFGSVYVIGQVAAYVLKTGAALLMLGPFDHAGGAFFGLIKGLFVVQVLLIVFAAYPTLHLMDDVDESEFGRFFVDDISFILWFLPGEFDDRIDDFLSPEPAVAQTPGTFAAF